MRMLIQDRGSGKTTKLIHASEATGFRILTNTYQQAEYIMKMAEEMKCVIPEPMCYRRYKECKFKDKGILIDEVKIMLDEILDEYFGTHVFCGTMSDTLKEMGNK